jgi:hypothetical protein
MSGSAFHRQLALTIQPHLERIERLLGSSYALTLVARHTPEMPADADIILTRDDLDKVKAAIDRLKDRDPVVRAEV